MLLCKVCEEDCWNKPFLVEYLWLIIKCLDHAIVSVSTAAKVTKAKVTKAKVTKAKVTICKVTINRVTSGKVIQGNNLEGNKKRGVSNNKEM